MKNQVELNKSAQKQKLYSPKPQTLKDQAQLIMDTPALRKLREQKEDTRSNKQSTSRLNELHPSILTQPTIEKSKKEAREERRAELKLKTVDTTDKEDQPMEGVQVSREDTNKPRVSKRNLPKHIRLVSGSDPYSIVEDLNGTQAQISIAQLLDVSPKVKADLVKKLKFEKDDMVNLVHKVQIAISKCKVYDVPSQVYLDYGAGMNLISKTFFEKLPVKPEPIGISECSIVQVLSDTDPTPGRIYRLPFTIGNHTFETDFRLVEKDNLLFDIIICYETIIENYLFINPVTLELCQINTNLEPGKIADIFKEIADKYQLWNVVENLDKVDRSDEEELPASTLVNLILVKEPLPLKVYETSQKLNCFSKVFQFQESSDVKVMSQESECSAKMFQFQETTDRDQVIDKLLQDKILVKDIATGERVRKLLNKYRKIIALSTDDLNKTSLYPHAIRLKENSQPVKQRAYRTSKMKADIIKEELTKLLNKGLIAPSQSPWSSPVVLMPKKNGKWRLCIDYRRLNELTIKDAYSIPFIEEILFSIGGKVEAISTLDLFSGYHQIPMKKEDVEKTSFTTMFGNYNFLVMPFGLTNAPATFQREMNRIFFPLIGKCMFVYIDDVVIFSPSVEQHLIDLEAVFKVILDNGLKINLEKCQFFKESVEVLGHLLTTNGVKPTEDKILAIRNWITPKNVTQLRSFLGTVGYYRKFIPNFAKRAAVLYGLLKKGQEYVWQRIHQGSFEELKEYLIRDPILKFPDFSKPFIIRTDASYKGFGGVLIQKHDNTEFPVHYVSRTLKKEEKNYPITKLEGAAAYFCVMKFKPFITGNDMDTLLITDHKPLVGLFKNRQPVDHDKQLTNWILTFSMLKVTVQYEEGKKNVIADALSRLPTELEKQDTLNEGKVVTINTTQIMNEFIDSKIKEMDGIKYYQDHGRLRKFIEDEPTKITLLNQAHSVGHEGVFQTYNRLIRDYYWPGMISDVRKLVKTCHKCQLFRPRPYPKEETYRTPAEAPFVRVGSDLVGPLTLTQKGNQYLVVLVDYFTSWVEAEPLKKIESIDIIEFLREVFCRHGVPEILITDNGSQFISKETKGFLDLYDVYIQPVTTYHPESNGKVENRNKELVKYLRLLGQSEYE